MNTHTHTHTRQLIRHFLAGRRRRRNIRPVFASRLIVLQIIAFFVVFFSHKSVICLLHAGPNSAAAAAGAFRIAFNCYLTREGAR